MERLVIAPEIQQAVADGRPVVALESAVITHGLAYPENLETARRLEATVRDPGAIPATIAVVDGCLRVGLSPAELERLASAGNAAKVSRRDLAAALAQGGLGGTTVAATMLIARRAGIRVMATGGIGGVSRGGAATLDVSADLAELGRTDIIVVCAGTKSLMDPRLTFEVLETNGVPVLGYQTGDLPAFYCRSSGLPVDRRVETAGEIAAIARLHWELGLPAAILVTVPLPPAFALDPTEVEQAVAEALRAAEAAGQRGRDLTPFALSALHRLTGGRSVRANVALLEQNARVAAEIAAAVGGRQ